MAQETFVVLVNLVVDQCLLLHQLGIDSTLEALDNLTENGLVEHQLFAVHYALYIMTG